MPNYTLHLGDCLEVMKTMPENSVDAIVCDPPYGLSDGPTKYLGDGGRGGFMGKNWDHGVPGVPFWEAALKVAKPGAMLLAFGGTRTHHRLMVAIEDAGWEIRDVCMWLYGSGFPKSASVSKLIDKAAGAEREVIGSKLGRPGMAKDGSNQRNGFDSAFGGVASGPMSSDITAPATDAARTWDGWGTALKPAWEPIIMARKPLSEPTIAANVLKHGTGALNIDACRIEGGSRKHVENSGGQAHGGLEYGTKYGSRGLGTTTQGRWPANLILDEEAAAQLDEQTISANARCARGDSAGIGVYASNGQVYGNGKGLVSQPKDKTPVGYGNGAPGASRFFYVAKASKRDRDEGLEGMPEKPIRPDGTRQWGSHDIFNTPGNGRNTDNRPRANHHPTVKPTALMRWLVRLVTPRGGTVLDPFAGSGSTLKAAILEGFDCIGIELDAEYLAIAQARCDHALAQAQEQAQQQQQLSLLEKI